MQSHTQEAEQAADLEQNPPATDQDIATEASEAVPKLDLPSLAELAAPSVPALTRLADSPMEENPAPLDPPIVSLPVTSAPGPNAASLQPASMDFLRQQALQNIPARPPIAASGPSQSNSNLPNLQVSLIHSIQRDICPAHLNRRVNAEANHDIVFTFCRHDLQSA